MEYHVQFITQALEPVAEEHCAWCLEEDGLCGLCAVLDRSLLPQLTEPYWYRLVGETRVEQEARQAPEPLTESEQRAVESCKRRKDRRERKARQRALLVAQVVELAQARATEARGIAA